MHTEQYCDKLNKLNRVGAIRAIHCAWLQLHAMGERVDVDGTTYDNNQALERLEECLRAAGHPGFAPEYDAEKNAVGV